MIKRETLPECRNVKLPSDGRHKYRRPPIMMQSPDNTAEKKYIELYRKLKKKKRLRLSVYERVTAAEVINENYKRNVIIINNDVIKNRIPM